MLKGPRTQGSLVTTSPETTSTGRHTVGPLAIGGVIVAVGAIILSFTHARPVTDAVVYRFGGELLLRDPTALYEASSPNALPFTYPPFAALLFAPLSWLSEAATTVVMSVATLAALLRISFLVWPRALIEAGLVDPDGRAALRRAASAAVALTPLAFLLEPVWETLRFGQINVLLCWLVIEDALAPPSRRWQGALVGLATGIKLTPAIFIGGFALGQRWRAVAMAIGCAATTVAIGFIVAPGPAADFWFGGSLGADRVGANEFGGNQSLNGLVWRLTNEGGADWLWATAVVVAVVAGALVTRRWWASGSALSATATMALVGLLVSAISWSHHWVWVWVLAAPLVALTVSANRRGEPTIAITGALLGVTWLIVTIGRAVWWLPTGDGIEFDRGAAAALGSSPYVLLGVLTLGWLAATQRRLSALTVVPA
jgi:alpha-1,2-mannosyltransferase